MALCLPPELWFQVFDHLDSPALAACAPLSSHFCPLAQARLFVHVYLLPRRRPSATALVPRSSLSVSNLPDACAKLFHLLSMSPHLARHIKRLSILDGTLFPSFRSFSAQPPGVREKLNGAPWFLSTSPHVLHALLAKLNLQSFHLIFPDGPKVSWSHIPQGIRTALDLILTSPYLQSLQLSNISFDSPTTLHDLTSTLSQGSITHLILDNIKLYPYLPLPPTWRGTSSHPKLLACPEKKRLSSSWHARSFSQHTPDPPLSSQNQNQTSNLTRGVLQLDSLSISSDPLHQQDPETLHLLCTLLLVSADFTKSSPLVSPYALKRLTVPRVDKETLSEIIRVLEESGASRGLLHMEGMPTV